MKVYSNAKHHRRSSLLNPTIASNISALANMLQPHPDQHSSKGESDTEGQAMVLARQFVSALNDPYRTMLLYPLVVDSHCKYPADAIFQQTTYPTELHPLLSLYLHKASAHSAIERRSRKIIDIFYLFLAAEAPTSLDTWLETENRQSLGEWFFSECLAGFCQLLFPNKKDYTVFLGNFLQFGLAYLFLAAASALKHEGPPEINEGVLRRVRANFVERYGLQDS